MKLEPCRSMNPDSGKMCDMAQGHFGAHVVGNPYHPVERWVTPCSDHRFHEHDAGPAECIYCGEKEGK